MKKKFINNSLKYLETKKDLTDLERKKLKYGLEGFYNLFTKLIVLITLTLILNVFKEFLLLTFIYSLLRLYGFGIHAQKSWQCWVTTLPIYLIGSLLIKYLTINQYIIFIIWIFGTLSFILFAPADTKSRPLIHKEKRLRAKFLSLVIIFILFLINWLYPNQELMNASVYALIMQSIAMNPITYKIFKAPYNNYKVYSQKTV